MAVLDRPGEGTSALVPSDGQRRVVEAPASSRMFVLAGPGVGKTWTLLQRAVNLRSEGRMGVGDVLVLSFTRAVVAELRARDRELEDRARIYPETFDAFASRLLRAHAVDENWCRAGFDGRIKAATRLVRDGATAPTLERVQHILLDEVQDLVGVRSEFVSALLEVHEGGVTAFGDPAQAIYEDDGASSPFTDDVSTWADQTVLLEGCRRFGGARAARTELLRSRLIEADGLATDGIRREFDDLLSLGDAAVAAPTFSAPGRTSAVLCRDNVTALQLSEALHRAGVRHELRRSSSDRPASPWVAAVFGGRSSVTEDAVVSCIAELQDVDLPGVPDAVEAWRLLCRLDRAARGGAVRAAEVRSALALGRVPWELHEQPGSSLVISSIHRAKGLEFDDCMIVDWAPRPDEELAEARILFVALTRARRDTWHATFEKEGRWCRRGDAQGRFVKCGPQSWHSFGVELRAGDVHAHDPGGTFVIERDAEEVQHLLLTAVRPGDLVDLHYSGEHDLGFGSAPTYSVVHAVHGEIGVTGADLGRALQTRLRSRRRPAAITGVRVEGLESVTGSPELAEAAGMGRSGIWLRPRLVGLGEFAWG